MTDVIRLRKRIRRGDPSPVTTEISCRLLFWKQYISSALRFALPPPGYADVSVAKSQRAPQTHAYLICNRSRRHQPSTVWSHRIQGQVPVKSTMKFSTLAIISACYAGSVQAFAPAQVKPFGFQVRPGYRPFLVRRMSLHRNCKYRRSTPSCSTSRLQVRLGLPCQPTCRCDERRLSSRIQLPTCRATSSTRARHRRLALVGSTAVVFHATYGYLVPYSIGAFTSCPTP